MKKYVTNSNVTNLNHLEIIEVLVFHDYPRNFICKNKEGKVFKFIELRATFTLGIRDIEEYYEWEVEELN